MTLKPRATGNLIFSSVHVDSGGWGIGAAEDGIREKRRQMQHLQRAGFEEGFGATPELSVFGVMCMKMSMESGQLKMSQSRQGLSSKAAVPRGGLLTTKGIVSVAMFISDSASASASTHPAQGGGRAAELSLADSRPMAFCITPT